MITADRSLKIDGMTCKRCAERIETALLALSEVEQAEVSADGGTAELSLTGEVDAARLQSAVASAGDYRVVADEPRSSRASSEQEGEGRNADADADDDASLYPLFLVVGFIAGVTVLIAAKTGDWSIQPLMRHFMAGFFIVFSFFKLLDLPGFVSTYRDYDLLAMKWKAWAWIYPFVELGLGILYLFAWLPIATNVFTFILMLTGAAGVLVALRKGKSLDCGCLGTALDLPMTKVTLIEDLSMAAMAALMIALI